MTLGDRVAVLRKGVLQQVASPRELYQHPVNLFVAGFIGSPPMNLLPATVDGNQLHLPIADVTVSPEVAAKVAEYDLLIAGVRPENFEDTRVVDDEVKRLGAEFRAKVDVVEWLGSEQFAYIPYEAPPEVRPSLAALAEEMDSEQLRTQIVVKLDASGEIRAGSEADLWLDPRKLHLFDPATGENLTA